jgi:hypothetical protein
MARTRRKGGGGLVNRFSRFFGRTQKTPEFDVKKKIEELLSRVDHVEKELFKRVDHVEKEIFKMKHPHPFQAAPYNSSE